MAQAAEETGWGDSEIKDIYSGTKSNNLFGIKYFGSKSNTDDYVLSWTSEYIKPNQMDYWKVEHAKWALEGESLVNTGVKIVKGKLKLKLYNHLEFMIQKMKV